MLKVDNSETMRALERATSQLKEELPRAMMAAVKTAAFFELTEKTYTRRTGNMDRNTKGRLVSRSGNDVTVEFAMDTEYASYLIRRGYTAFTDAGIAARETIQDAIDAMGSDKI